MRCPAAPAQEGTGATAPLRPGVEEAASQEQLQIRARQRLISQFDLELTQPEWALGYRFDIVLRGRESTPFEERA